MTETNLLQHLLRSGLTPSFSFPLDVAEFRADGLVQNRTHTWPKMQNDLKKALVEYSPGRVLTVDGTDYRVQGLYIYAPSDGISHAEEHFAGGVDFDRLWYYNRCTDDACGWVSSDLRTMQYPGDERGDCPVCGKLASVRSDVWYRPDGFAPKLVPWNIKGSRPQRGGSWSPTMKPEVVRNTSRVEPAGGVEFPAPVSGDDMGEFIAYGSESLAASTTVSDEERAVLQGMLSRVHLRSTRDDGQGIELLLVNSGYQGQGYYICRLCGLIDKQQNLAMVNEGEGHFRPYVPMPDPDEEDVGPNHPSRQKCHGASVTLDGRESLYLGMLFRTDVLILSIEIQQPFEQSQRTTRDRQLNDGLVTLKEAIITCLQREMLYNNREIQGGIRKRAVRDDQGVIQSTFAEVFLYDDVSGGAGLTSSLMTQEDSWSALMRILEDVELQLGGTRCLNGVGCESACIGCLLDFRNSAEHSRLNRHEGLRLLRYIMEGTVPQPSTHELESIARTQNELLQELDPSMLVEVQGGRLRITRNSDELFIYPMVNYVDPYEDPRVVELNEADVEFEVHNEEGDFFEENAVHATLPMRVMMREPSFVAERIHARLDPEYLD